MIAGPPRTRYKATFTVLAAAVAAYALLQSLVTPVLPTIAAGLHTSQNTVTWVLTAYLLSASIFTPIMHRRRETGRAGIPGPDSRPLSWTAAALLSGWLELA